MTTWNQVSGTYAYHEDAGYGGSYTLPVCDPVWTQNFQNFYTRTSRTLCGIFAGYTYHEVQPLHRLPVHFQDSFWDAVIDLIHHDHTDYKTRAFLLFLAELEGQITEEQATHF